MPHPQRSTDADPTSTGWPDTLDTATSQPWFGDPLFSVGFGLWSLSLVLAVAPFIPDDLRYNFSDLWADFVTLPFFLFLALLNARKATSSRETKFWSLVVAALTSWLAVRVMYVWPNPDWGITEDVTTDILYGFFYLMLALALEMKPHENAEIEDGPSVLTSRRDGVPLTTTVIFFAATVAYFVIIPAHQSPESYRYWLFSFGLYVVLDLYLFGRVLALGHHQEAPWSTVYRWLAATFVLWAMTDGTEGLMYAERLPWMEPGTPYDIIWYIPGLALLVALRCRWWPAEAA